MKEQPNIDTLIKRVAEYSASGDGERLWRAYGFAEKAHAGQERLTGDPYISHPLAVANILAEIQADPMAIAAALLHDTVEDTDVSIEDIQEQFGERIAHLVAGVTKLTQLDFSSRQDQQAQNLRTSSWPTGCTICGHWNHWSRRIASAMPAKRSISLPRWLIVWECRKSTGSWKTYL